MLRNRRTVALVGLMLVVVILLTGTWAWQAFRQGAFNPAWDIEAPDYGGRVHDDYEVVEGPGCRDKDIYAENFGNRDLFVRIQLREFLQIGDEPAFGGATITDPSTWPIFNSNADDVHARRAGTVAADIGDEGIEWTLGHGSGVDKWFLPTHNHATRPVAPGEIQPNVPVPFNNPEAYRFSNTTGGAREQIAGGFNINEQTSAEDIHNNGFITGPTISDGTSNFWSEGDTYTSDLIYIAEDGTLSVQPEVTHVAQRTMIPDEGGVMTLTQWNAAGQPDGNFWILDSENPGGWFYWNGYLPTGEATSLLLNGICIEDRSEAWQYVIFMNADFFTSDSIDDLEPNISDDIRDIFIPPTESPELILPDEVGGEWVDSTGVEWCMLIPASEAAGGVGNALMITTHVHQTVPGQPVQYNTPNEFRLFESSTLRTTMNSWYHNNANVSPELRETSLNYTFQNNSNRGVTGAGIEVDTNNGLAGPWLSNEERSTIDLARATTLPTGNPGNGEVFVLSSSEVNRYMPYVLIDEDGDCRTRQAILHHDHTQALWWLRSPGAHEDAFVAGITFNGNHAQSSLVFREHMALGFRAALWVRQ